MTDAQYAPLSAALVRTLSDKVYDKRKTAAIDIEKFVRELIQTNQLSQLEKLLKVLDDLTKSQNRNTKKGGLLGLAAAAVVLGKDISNYTSQLIDPVLPCFNDQDSRVRYHACESLYNIVKVCRSSALGHFNVIFDALWKLLYELQLSVDFDVNVRSGAEVLDRLMKDIVIGSGSFDVSRLMVLIKERIYSEDSGSRRFIVSWLSALLTAPEISLLPYIPEVLDGVFQMLDDSQSGLRDATESVLGQFLESIRSADEKDNIELGVMVNVLILHIVNVKNEVERKIALFWLDQFLQMRTSQLLPYLSGYLTAILPYLDDSELKAKSINERLLKLYTSDTDVELDAVIEVLLKHEKHPKRETRVAILKWLKHIHTTAPEKLHVFMDRIFPLLFSLILDSCDDVLLLDLQLICDICENDTNELKSTDEPYRNDEMKKQLSGISSHLVKFAVSLLSMFRNDPVLLNDRGVLIIRQLCLLLDPTLVFRCLAVLLLYEENVQFVVQMVSILNGILFTATELYAMRSQLKYLDKFVVIIRLEITENASLFECLYRCWCNQPIALLGLCIMSQNYKHASDLAKYLSKINVTVDVLVEIDKLVQLIESPILSYVRLDLLNPVHRRPLAFVLSSLLMLLPQTDAFNTLLKRLQCVQAPFFVELVS
uniref:Protein VAC14 homolog n=1 Tax=Syphacia muris TaxID=451379 RepID=A0A0N5AYH7_9BILA